MAIIENIANGFKGKNFVEYSRHKRGEATDLIRLHHEGKGVLIPTVVIIRHVPTAEQGKHLVGRVELQRDSNSGVSIHADGTMNIKMTGVNPSEHDWLIKHAKRLHELMEEHDEQL